MFQSHGMRISAVLAASFALAACGGPGEEVTEQTDSASVAAETPQALATPLSANISFCNNTAMLRVICGGSGSGGAPPYSFLWSSLTPTMADFTQATTAQGRGLCIANTVPTVQLQVTDSLGATATSTLSFFCDPNP